MDPTKVARIKEAVKAHFNDSPSYYQAFEERHGFFTTLNAALLSLMRIPEAAEILDVGCGTGASCIQILKAVPGSRVRGLDISSAMLEQARNMVGESDRISFVEGDAGRLTEYFDFPFDAIVYSASIFLVPDFRESLRQARDLLKPNGSVGLSFMEGLYDPDGNNLVVLADQAADLGVSLKRPVKLDDFRIFFAELFPVNQVRQEEFRLPLEVLREFFSVPAMSAGLFPGIPYPDRVNKVNRLFEHIHPNGVHFRWMLMVGTKTG